MNDKSTTLEPTREALAGDSLWRVAKRLFLATRPKFYPASVLPVLVGTAWGYRIGGTFDWLAFLLALLATVTVHAASNVLNDVGDEISGTDQQNTERIYPYTGGSRFIQNEVMSLKEMSTLGMMLFATAVVLGVALVLLKGPGVLVFGLIGIALGVVYSLPRIQISARGIGELAVAVAFGALPVTGAAWLQSGRLDSTALLVSLPVSMWVAAILLINEVPDVTADAAAGKRTLPVRLGSDGTAWLYFGLHGVGFLGILALAFEGSLPWLAISVPALLLLLAFKATRGIINGDREPLKQSIEMTLGIHTIGCIWLVAAILYTVWH